MNSSIEKFILLFNRGLVQKILQPAVTNGGLYLTSKLLNQNVGKIVAVSEGDYNDKGILIPSILKVGQTVLLPKRKGIKIEMKDKTHEYELYEQKDILGIIEGYKH
jgi:co-chaperonin GroES (HSP10)